MDKIGFFGLLTIVFIILKLTNVIAWSWFFVLLPLIGPAVVLFFVFIFLMMMSTRFYR